MKGIVIGVCLLLLAATVGIMVMLGSQLYPLVSDLKGGLKMEELKVKITGTENIDVASLLPVAQIFLGKAVFLEEAPPVGQSSQVTTSELALTVPSGWTLSKEYTALNSYAVLLRDQDGNFATISKSTAPQSQEPQEFLADMARRYSRLMDISGFEVVSYTALMPDGRQVQAINAQGANIMMEIRGWVAPSTDNIYVVALTSRPQQLVVSEKIFDSFTW